MRNILPYHVLIAVFLASFFTGCAMKVDIVSIAPAEYEDVADYRTVAVLNFDVKESFGNTEGRMYTSIFETVLKNAEVNGKKIFTIVDRANMDAILKEYKFQMTMAEADQTKIGETLGLDGIWSGNVEEDYNYRKWHENDVRCDKYDNTSSCVSYKLYKYECMEKSIAVSIAPKLTSVATGKVVYSNILSGSDSSVRCRNNLNSVTRKDLWNNAMADILAQFRKDVAPYGLVTEVELITSDKDIKNGKAKKLFKEGLKFMQNNRKKLACKLWSEGLKTDNESAALAYNAAICEEMNDNYEEAIKKLKYARELSTKYDKLINKAIRRNFNNIQNTKKIMEQIGA